MMTGQYRRRRTSPNGDCGKNALALALHDLITQGELSALSQAKQEVIFEITAELKVKQPGYASSTSWDGFIRAVKRLRGDRQIEIFLVPILRHLLKRIVTSNITNKHSTYHITTPTSLRDENPDITDFEITRAILNAENECFRIKLQAYTHELFNVLSGATRVRPNTVFHTTPAIRKAITAFYHQYITEPLKELASINPNELDADNVEQQGRYQKLLEIEKVKKLLAKGTAPASVDDDLMLKQFMEPILDEIYEYWYEEGQQAFAERLSEPRRWIDNTDLEALTDFFNLGMISVDMHDAHDRFNVENLPRYPNEFLQSLTENQRLKLNRANIISDSGCYCEIWPPAKKEEQRDRPLIARLNALKFEDEDFANFDLEEILRLNFENNHMPHKVHFEHQGNHWIYLQPAHGYADARYEPDHLKLLVASPLCFDLELHPDLAEHIGQFVTEHQPSFGNEANLSPDDVFAYINALHQQYAQAVQNFFSVEEQQRAKAAYKISPSKPRAFCDAIYQALRRFPERDINPAVLSYILSENKDYATYYAPQKDDDNTWVSLCYQAYQHLDMHAIKQFFAADPEIIKQPAAHVFIPGSRSLPLFPLHIMLANPDCTTEQVRALLDMGAPLGGVNQDGKTVLQLAIEHGKLEIAFILLNHQSTVPGDSLNLEHRDSEGKSILDHINVKDLNIPLPTGTLGEALAEATQTLKANLSALYDLATELSDGSEAKHAVLDTVTNVFVELKKLEKSNFSQTQAKNYFKTCQKIAEKNAKSIYNYEYAWQLFLNVLYGITIVGTLHMVGSALYYKFILNENPSLFFASAAQVSSYQLSSLMGKIVQFYTEPASLEAALNADEPEHAPGNAGGITEPVGSPEITVF